MYAVTFDAAILEVAVWCCLPDVLVVFILKNLFVDDPLEAGQSVIYHFYWCGWTKVARLSLRLGCLASIVTKSLMESTLEMPWVFRSSGISCGVYMWSSPHVVSDAVFSKESI